MTRTWPVPRVPGSCYSPKYIRMQRTQSGIHTGHRRTIQVDRDRFLAELRSLDDQLDGLSARRVQLLDRLDELRDQLWPESPTSHSRRPPALDRPPLPPLVDGVRMTGGRELRGLCLTMLGRHGALALPDMHALLHRYGYGIAGDQPVKALAEAMAYEVRCNRAVRVRRGVYDLSVDGRSSGYRNSPDPRRGLEPTPTGPLPWADVPVDAALRTDPERWMAAAWPDPPGADPDDPPEPSDPPEPGGTADPENAVPPWTSTDRTPADPLGSESVQIRTRGSGEGFAGGNRSGGGQTGNRRPARDEPG